MNKKKQTTFDILTDMDLSIIKAAEENSKINGEPTEEDVEKFIKESPKPLTTFEAYRRLRSDIKEAKELIKKEFPVLDIDKYVIKINKSMESLARYCKKHFKKT